MLLKFKSLPPELWTELWYNSESNIPVLSRPGAL
jgi:hypothetical protein